MDGVSDRNSRLDDNSRFCISVCSYFFDETQYIFYCRAVKEVGLGIIVGRCGNDDILSIRICGFGICCGIKSQSSLFMFCQIPFYIIILNRALPGIDHIHFFFNDIHCRYIVMLGKKHCKREAYIAGSCHSNLLAFHFRHFDLIIDNDIARFKAKHSR